MNQPRVEPSEAIVAAVVEVLADRVLSEAEILEELAERGVELGEDPDLVLDDVLSEEQSELFVSTVDGRIGTVDGLLWDRWFTHELGEDECKYDVLAINNDLMVFGVFFGADADSLQSFTDGTGLSIAMSAQARTLRPRGLPSSAVPEAGVFVLDVGVLANLEAAPGDLVGLRATRNGWELRVVLSDSLGVASGLLTALTEVVTEAVDEGWEDPLTLDLAIWSACVDHPELFLGPLPPLAGVLEESDLQVFGERVALATFDMDLWRQAGLAGALTLLGLSNEAAWQTSKIISMVEFLDRMLTLEYPESEGDHADLPVPESVMNVSAALARAPSTGNDANDATGVLDETVLALTPALENPEVAEAVLSHTLMFGHASPAALGLFAESALETPAPREARAGLWWLQGRTQELLGDAIEAEMSFAESLKYDRSYSVSLNSMARCKSDRGQAPAMKPLLDRAGEEADSMLVEVCSRYVPQVRADVARNAPCWCGSGKKYKKCHLRDAQSSLAERGFWLYVKSLTYLVQDHRHVVIALAGVRAEYSDAPMAMLEALDNDFLLSTALFEEGVFEAFLRDREELLPADESLTGQAWLLRELSVFEVESVSPGESMTLRDVRTGETVRLQERTGSRSLEVGQLFCARILPVDDVWQVFGGVEPVGLHERDELIELLDSNPPASELVDFFARKLAPPIMQTTEGEDIVFCEATYQISDSVALVAALDAKFDRIDDSEEGAACWIENIQVLGVDRVRATLTQTEDQLSVSTNSEERLDRIQAWLDSIDQHNTRVSHERIPFDMESASDGVDNGEWDDLDIGMSPHDALAEPEIAAVMADLIAKHESAWLDESIPALSGYTPREAVVDPTRRDDVIRLLNSFPPTGGQVGVMDPDRLRAALGI